MKLILTLGLLFCLSGFVNCQKPTKCWLPEKYVNKVLNKDTIDCSKLLIPIEGFEEIEKKMYMLTYKGELNSLQNIKIVQGSDTVKIQILGISGLINLKYISRDSLKKYASWKYYYTKINNDIMLEIVQQDKRKIEIKFISQFLDYQFKSIKETKAYLYNYK
jgi:hypothetical protein